MLLKPYFIKIVTQLIFLAEDLGRRNYIVRFWRKKAGSCSASICICESANFNDQIVHLSSQKAYYKPVLFSYDIAAVYLTFE